MQNKAFILIWTVLTFLLLTFHIFQLLVVKKNTLLVSFELLDMRLTQDYELSVVTWPNDMLQHTGYSFWLLVLNIMVGEQWKGNCSSYSQRS